jgi:hypothetical protein
MIYPKLDDFEYVGDIFYRYKTSDFDLRLYPIKRGYLVVLYNQDGSIYDSDSTHLHRWFHSLMAYGAARKIYIRLIDKFYEDKTLQTNGNQTIKTGGRP